MHTTKTTSLKLPGKIQFGLVLKQKRESLRLSQEALAEKAGLHRTYISQVERGVRNLSIDSMERLAEAVDMEVWEMLRTDTHNDSAKD